MGLSQYIMYSASRDSPDWLSDPAYVTAVLFQNSWFDFVQKSPNTKWTVNMLTDSAFCAEIISTCHFPGSPQVGQDRPSAIFLHQPEFAREAFIGHAVMVKLIATMGLELYDLAAHSSSVQRLNKLIYLFCDDPFSLARCKSSPQGSYSRWQKPPNKSGRSLSLAFQNIPRCPRPPRWEPWT